MTKNDWLRVLIKVIVLGISIGLTFFIAWANLPLWGTILCVFILTLFMFNALYSDDYNFINKRDNKE